MLGALASLLGLWLRALLQLSQTVGDIFLFYLVAIFQSALANHERQGLWWAFPHMKPEGTQTITPVTLLGRRRPRVDSGHHSSRGEANQVGPGKRKGRQALAPTQGHESPHPKRARRSKLVRWRFYLPSPEEAARESQDYQSISKHLKEQKEHTRILRVRLDTPRCELRSRNGASTELRSRNGTSSNLFGGSTQAPENWICRGPAPEPLIPVAFRPRPRPKRTLPGRFTGKQNFSGFALSSGMYNG
ncbi:unnamed protein product [Linum trigynum]|uniref:Uncharacterized protein n=1 Tax=Linum trigynum TaxID=586398 RepID=A0AAV2G659_9ROSI